MCLPLARRSSAESPAGSRAGRSNILEELRRLEGMPPEVLENPELMRIALPALRADANLYRQYVYEPAIRCNSDTRLRRQVDPNIEPRALERWREQTTTAFMEQFEGGHFFFQTPQAEFLSDVWLLSCDDRISLRRLAVRRPVVRSFPRQLRPQPEERR